MLHLLCECKNIEEFIKNTLNLPPNQHKRYIIRTKTGETGVHFAAINIFKDNENKTSLIFIDASRGENAFIPFNIMLNIKDKDNLESLYIYSQIQNSPGDCLLFCLHFLKKMNKHSQHFIKIHQKIFNHEIEFTSTGIPAHTAHTPNKLLTNDECKKYRVVYFDQAINLLPIDFFKHAHSIKPINAYLTRHPDESQKKVNKWQGGETLTERYQRHCVTRNINGRSLNYSASIEAKRLSLVEAALSWLDEHEG